MREEHQQRKPYRRLRKEAKLNQSWTPEERSRINVCFYYYFESAIHYFDVMDMNNYSSKTK